jgi:hypothetical protein
MSRDRSTFGRIRGLTAIAAALRGTAALEIVPLGGAHPVIELIVNVAADASCELPEGFI